MEAPLKTKNSYRAVSIGAEAAGILKEQKAKVPHLWQGAALGGIGGNQPLPYRQIKCRRNHLVGVYVFPSPTGGPISPDSVIQMLHRVLKRAGLPKVWFHDLRHPNVKPKTQIFISEAKIQGFSDDPYFQQICRDKYDEYLRNPGVTKVKGCLKESSVLGILSYCLIFLDFCFANADCRCCLEPAVSVF